MNNGALNTFAVNGAVADPVVRSSVVVRAYALVAGTPRVFAYLRPSPVASALVTGAVGRLLVRASGLAVRAEGQLSGPLHRVVARLKTAVACEARVAISSYRVRLVLGMAARAIAQAAARVYVRQPTTAGASALSSLVVRPRFKAVVSAVAEAMPLCSPTIYPRRYLRSAVSVTPSALSSVVSRALRRSRLQSFAYSNAVMSPRVFARASSTAFAEAKIDVDFGVIKQIPWDEPAPDERVFVVSPETFVFKVA